MPKRILVVSQHYWPENFRIADICRGFTEDQIEVDVLCGLPNYPKGEWFDGYRYSGPRRQTHDGVEIFRAGEIRRKGNTSVRIFLNYISYPLTAVLNLPRLHGRKYDAVFCYETSPVLMLFPAILYAKLHRLPLTCYVLDLWPENLYSVLPVHNRLLRTIAEKVSHWHYRRCEKLIAMSPALEEKLRAVAPRAQLTTIPQYCEDLYARDVFDANLEKRFKGRFNVLFAGNISPAQDLGLLVQCAEKLRQDKRADIHFIIVGDGMSRTNLEEEIRGKDLSSYFTFEGQHPVTDIPAYHTMADALFAALAKSDELGLTVPAKITSYMAAGRPCLVAGCGLTSPAGDAHALYQNLLALAAMSPEQRTAMGQAGRAYFEQHFRRSKLLKKLEQFIFDSNEVTP